MSAAAWARKTEHIISFPLYKQGTVARRFHYLLGIAVLEQGIEMCWIFLESLVECQWGDNILYRTQRIAMVIVRVGN